MVIEGGEFKSEVGFDKLSANHLVVSWLLVIEVSSKIWSIVMVRKQSEYAVLFFFIAITMYRAVFERPV
jgi:hypothetical protein